MTTKAAKESVSSKTPLPEEGDIDKDEYELWLEEAELNDLVDVADVPAFNVPFAKLIKEVIKCNDAFMDLMRVEGHIYSYDKFVSTMGTRMSEKRCKVLRMTQRTSNDRVL